MNPYNLQITRWSLIAIFTLAFCTQSYLQEFKGLVNDKTQPLISATVQITNKATLEVHFAITDQDGRFAIKLSYGDYTMITRYLGYNENINDLTWSEEMKGIMEITLVENENLLNEVEIISAPPAIIHKKDTTIFFADSFAIGDERKLRELLEKFPDLSVEGNRVTYKGKPITKLLVENRDFFTGSVGFGINNLPADAVSTVEV